jgi:glucose-6-phosphate 1-dehydrogenase
MRSLLQAVVGLLALVSAQASFHQLVVVGASGSLSQSKGLPAAFRLWQTTGRSLRVYAAVREQSEVGGLLSPQRLCGNLAEAGCLEEASSFVNAGHVSVHVAPDAESYRSVGERLNADAAASGSDVVRRAFHLAIPPSAFVPVARILAEHCLPANLNLGSSVSATLLVEKPVGNSHSQATEMIGELERLWGAAGGTLAFVDHYLAKGALHAMASFRAAAGPRFNSLWHWSRLNHVSVVAEEAAGLEGRTKTFEGLGGYFRDMAQNHLSVLAASAFGPLALGNDVAAAAELVEFSSAQVEAGGDAVDSQGWSWTRGPLDTTAAILPEGKAPPPERASSVPLAGPASSWGDVAALLEGRSLVGPAERLAFFRGLNLARPMNDKYKTVVVGQYKSYVKDSIRERGDLGDTVEGALSKFLSRTVTAGRAAFTGSKPVFDDSSAESTFRLVPDLLGTPLIIAGGKKFPDRRLLARLDLHQRGRITLLGHGVMPVAVPEEDASSSGLAMWPTFEELNSTASLDRSSSRVQEQLAVTAQLAGTGHRIVEVPGPALVIERPVTLQSQLPLPAALPAAARAVIGAQGGGAPVFVALWEPPSLPETVSFEEAAVLFSSRTGDADPYSALFAEALSSRAARTAESGYSGELSLVASPDEVLVLWGVWDRVVEESNANTTVLRLYPDGDKTWLGLRSAGSLQCHDKACAFHAGSEDSKWLYLSRGSQPPMIRDLAQDMLEEEQRERRRRKHARELRRRRKKPTGMHRGDMFEAMWIDASDIDGRVCLGQDLKMHECDGLFDEADRLSAERLPLEESE